MGFFKKIFKGIGKVFKKIGRGIKKGFAKFGKFMGKMGIAGQLAMMFIVPGIGSALFKGLGSMVGNMASLSGSFAGLSGSALGTLVKGVGTVLKAGHGFVQTGLNAFKTVTSGLMEFGKTALNKIPGINIEGAATNFFGQNSVMEKITVDAKNILNPFKSSVNIGQGMSLDKLSGSTGLSVDQLKTLNPDLAGSMTETGFGDLTGKTINLDFEKVIPDVKGVANLGTTPTLPSVDTFGDDVVKSDALNFKVEPLGEKIDVGAVDSLTPGAVRSPLDMPPSPEFKDIGTGMLRDVRTMEAPVSVDSLLAPPTGTTGDSNFIMEGLKTGVEQVKTSFEQDPFGTIQKGVEMYDQYTAKPVEMDEGIRGPGYVVQALPMTSVEAADYTQQLNASLQPYGATASAMDYLGMSNLFGNTSQFAFPTMMGGGR